MPIPSGPAAPDLPDWAPTVQQVADYLPHRTLARSEVSITEGEDVYELTFDDTTRPTGLAVGRIISDGVAWVSARVAPMNVLSHTAAGVLATLYTCAMVERGWPNDDSSLERARDFEKRLDFMLTGLIASNDLANNPVPVPGDDDFAFDALPIWSFPCADPRYDDSRYF